MSENAKRRSEARDRRRSVARDRTGDSASEQTHDGDGMHQAVRSAAAAAAVGAAVGAARALATRADGKNRNDEHDDAEEPEGQSDEDQDEGSDPEARSPQQQEQEGEEEPGEEEADRQERPRRRQAPRSHQTPEPRHGASARTVRSMTDTAREQLRELQGKDPESVTSLERIGDAWRITFEVLEVERIPSSTDVLATYVVELDDDAQLLSFERIRRYARAQADRGDER
ncbi:MAG TPA: gas vesicle protein GvpO [Gaiellaceae bacterium]